MTVATPKVSYKTVTPEEAHVLLKRSKRKNVPVKKRKIDQYARDMINDKWDPFNSQAVSIDVNNDIVNRHQRLMACVQANKPFRTLFVQGVPPESFWTEDTGRTRDAGHFFALLGERYYVELASAARGLYSWERGLWKQAATTAGGGNVFVSNEDLQAEVERRPALRDASEWLGKKKEALRGRFKVGTVGTLWVLTQGHQRHVEFWKELVERLGDDRTSPAYQLNRRIDVAKSRGVNFSSVNLLAMLTKTWNIVAADEKKELVWAPGKEKFPQPLTSLEPALLPPKDNAEVITVSPVKRPRAKGPPELKLVPAPKKRAKNGPKLRGGLGG